MTIGFIGRYICLLLGHVVVVYEQVLVKGACTFSSGSNQKQIFLVITIVSGKLLACINFCFVFIFIFIFYFLTKEDIMFKLA